MDTFRIKRNRKRNQNNISKIKKKDHVFMVGQIVWAKVKGFSLWPAKVNVKSIFE